MAKRGSRQSWSSLHPHAPLHTSFAVARKLRRARVSHIAAWRADTAVSRHDGPCRTRHRVSYSRSATCSLAAPRHAELWSSAARCPDA
eukprot:6463840-Prymnesium_polylepis.1